MSVEERLTRLETIIMVLVATNGKIVRPQFAYEYGVSYEDMEKVIGSLFDIRRELRETDDK